jgi:hypothetical protein
MGVLNKKSALILVLVVALLSAVINFLIGQRHSADAAKPVVQEAAMTNPLPGEGTPPGIPMTPIPPGSPIATLAPGKPITTAAGE